MESRGTKPNSGKSAVHRANRSKPVDEADYLRLLSRVQRPGRYAGGERGAVVKDWNAVNIRACLCFPDLYELGMSYLGTAILYQLINRRTDCLAERCFAPGDDLYELLKESGTPLWSLETRRPLSAFDTLMFSFTYELSYPQFLRMLETGGIPLLARERGEHDPIVIAGGGCMVNPEPIADFIDAAGVGDGEVLIEPIIESLIATSSETGRKQLSRRERILALAKIPGVYVPSLYEASYEGGRFLELKLKRDSGSNSKQSENSSGIARSKTRDARAIGETAPEIPAVIARQFHLNLDECPIPVGYPVPNIEVVGDKNIVEILRGCPQGCRFCQAGYTYRPLRVRSADSIIASSRVLAAMSGRNEITLMSLTSLDHPGIARILARMREIFDPERVSVALPSLRMDSIGRELAVSMRRPRESSLTFAIEAGTQSLRDAINKQITEDDIFDTMEAVLDAGFHKFKLYFMCGFAGETMDDITKLGELITRIHAFCQSRGKRPVKLHISQAVLVPKPVTPFQWQAMERPSVSRAKQALLRRMLRPLNRLRFNWHDAETSLLEALFSRGDRRLGNVLFNAHKEGKSPPTLVDGSFNAQPWLAVARECGIDPDLLVHEEWPDERQFPWSHVDCGITNRFLARERDKYDTAELTKNCNEHCAACGIGC
ncbi:radical SAM protein [bacterium]|nr:radical SAM protein [bacterium]